MNARQVSQSLGTHMYESFSEAASYEYLSTIQG